jgi:hypothetical protein
MRSDILWACVIVAVVAVVFGGGILMGMGN